MSRRRFLCGALLLFVGPTTLLADSIWQRRSGRYGFLFNDNRARGVGDLLTVLISENNAIGQREQRQLSKSHNGNGSLTFAGSSSSDGTSRSGNLSTEATNTSSRQFQGNAQLNSNRTFVDRMSATVVDVLPNGNLVIEGNRIRIVSGERRIIRVTGIIRPADLSPANTIQSESVANLKLEYLGRGVDSQFVNQGWFGRIVNIFWPY
jgi:flagellar L-ring protein precursor FlgH